MPSINPSAKILIWVMLALLLPSLPASYFVPVFAALALFALLLRPPGLYKRLWRMRWLWLGIVLIYGLSQPLISVMVGWLDGALQAGRVMALLLFYAVLMGRAGSDNLLAGLYGLLWPLRKTGLPVDRVVLRLGLALCYVEQLGQIRGGDLLQLERLLQDLPQLSDTVELAVVKWRLHDGLLVVAGIILLGWWL